MDSSLWARILRMSDACCTLRKADAGWRIALWSACTSNSSLIISFIKRPLIHGIAESKGKCLRCLCVVALGLESRKAMTTPLQQLTWCVRRCFLCLHHRPLTGVRHLQWLTVARPLQYLWNNEFAIWTSCWLALRFANGHDGRQMNTASELRPKIRSRCNSCHLVERKLQSPVTTPRL